MLQQSKQPRSLQYRKRYWVSLVILVVFGVVVGALALEVLWRFFFNEMIIVLSANQRLGNALSITTSMLRNFIEASLWAVPCFTYLQSIPSKHIRTYLGILVAFIIIVTDLGGIYQVYPVVKTSLDSYIYVTVAEVAWYFLMWWLPCGFMLWAQFRYRRELEARRMRSTDPAEDVAVVPKFNKGLWWNVIAFMSLSPLATFLTLMNIFAEAEILVFLIGVPTCILMFFEFRQPPEKRSKWSLGWLFIFIFMSYSIVFVPRMIILMLKEMSGIGGEETFAMFLVVVLYNVVMGTFNTGTSVITSWATDKNVHAKFRLLTQVFDDIYGDVVFLFLRNFGPVFWVVIILKGIRIFLRDTGLGVKFVRGAIASWRNRNVTKPATPHELHEVKSRDKGPFASDIRDSTGSSEIQRARAGSVVLTHDMKIVTFNEQGNREESDEFQSVFSFTALKFVSEISASILVPWLIFIEVMILPQGGCQWACQGVWNSAAMLNLVYMYLVVLAFKIVAYICVYVNLWMRLVKLTQVNQSKVDLHVTDIRPETETPIYTETPGGPRTTQVRRVEESGRGSSTASLDLAERNRNADVYAEPTATTDVIRILGNYVVGQLKGSAFYYIMVLNMCLVILVGPVYHTTAV